ncbi:MAG TPA: alpha/beta fold hydrolase [Planctomycetota bacterium]|nr:alpha/beta fold hydrolase [Planctomycetota bacterium]
MRMIAALLLIALPGFAPQAQAPEYPPVAEVREAFLKQLDRPKVAADPVIVDTKVEGAYVVEQFTIATEKKRSGKIERLPVLLVRPQRPGWKHPVVVVLHGTGGTKESQRGWLQDLAKNGIIGVAVDARYHGARAEGEKGAARYVRAITEAWKAPAEEMEHPFYYDTVWDLWRLADYLETREDVDPRRLGMIGFSMGGIETWLAASVDARWKCSVPAIGVQSFKWSLDHDRWQGRAKTIAETHDTAAKDLGEPEVNQKVCRALWSKLIPGILDQFDCPSLIRMFAGRALLIPNGEVDPNCPIEGARIAFASAEAAFKAAGCPEKLKILVAEGVGHKVTPEQQAAALDWFVTWLKKE